jgi:uncharacterized membrane protein
MPALERLAVAMAAAVLAVLAAPGAQAQTLSAEEVVSLHAGRCVSYWGPSQGTQCFGADGTTTYRDRRYGSDTGRWEMRGDEMCVTWTREPGWDCGPIWRIDARTLTDGEYRWRPN